MKKAQTTKQNVPDVAPTVHFTEMDLQELWRLVRRFQSIDALIETESREETIARVHISGVLNPAVDDLGLYAVSALKGRRLTTTRKLKKLALAACCQHAARA